VTAQYHEIGRTLVVIWGAPIIADLAEVRRRLREFGDRLGRQPVYIAITPPESPAPTDEVRKEMLATMKETSDLTESLHLVLEGSGLKYSALRSMVASMFLLAGNRKIFVHSNLADALIRTSLTPAERDDIYATIKGARDAAVTS
jgi:hypothetical protein